MQLKHFLIRHSLKWVIIVSLLSFTQANPDAKRLYDDLLSNYNRLIRPVSNNTDTVLVKLGLRLSQLIELVSGNVTILHLVSALILTSISCHVPPFRCHHTDFYTFHSRTIDSMAIHDNFIPGFIVNHVEKSSWFLERFRGDEIMLNKQSSKLTKLLKKTRWCTVSHWLKGKRFKMFFFCRKQKSSETFKLNISGLNF